LFFQNKESRLTKSSQRNGGKEGTKASKRDRDEERKKKEEVTKTKKKDKNGTWKGLKTGRNK
jgi:hypothetical protein